MPFSSTPPTGTDDQFRLLADSAPVLIWIGDRDRRHTWFNQPWLRFTGRTMEQEIGDGWAEGVHPDDRELCLQVSLTAFDARQPFRGEYRRRRHDGEYRWILENGGPRFDDAGQFLGYIGTGVDITEQKQAQEQARIQ